MSAFSILKPLTSPDSNEDSNRHLKEEESIRAIGLVYSRQLLCGTMGRLSLGNRHPLQTSGVGDHPWKGHSQKRAICGFDGKCLFTWLSAVNLSTEAWRRLSLPPGEREDTIGPPCEGKPWAKILPSTFGIRLKGLLQNPWHIRLFLVYIYFF